MTSSAGVQYQNDKWQLIYGFDRQWDFQEPTLSATGSIKGFAEVEPTLMIYSLTGPGISIEAYIKAAVTEGFDPLCVAALDWGIWGGIEGSMKWKGNESIPVIGKVLKNLDLEFKFFEWDKKIYGGILNACGSEPPVLVVEGEDINRTIVEGSSESIQTIYTLTNQGNQTMP